MAAAENPNLERQVQRQIRRRYEMQRGILALLGAIPVLLVVSLACVYSQRATTSALLGGGAIVLGVVMLWRGQQAQRAVLPAVGLGAIPLTLALWANAAHGCCVAGGTCMAGMSSMCLPACSAGGLIAGGLLAVLGHRWRAGVWFWISATGMTLLVGATGCACVGYTGVLGLAIGYGIGAGVGATMARVMRRQG